MINFPAEPVWGWVAGLLIIGLMVLILPFRVKWCEHNLEVFFLIMGILSVSISAIFSYNLWSYELIVEALKAPVVIGSIPLGIFQVVLIFGLLIYFFNKPFYRAINTMVNKLSFRIFIFILIFVLGLISSIISVIVTSVILSEIVAAIPLNRDNRIKLVVTSCFSIGLGAVLTPLGEPMSTILVERLSHPPYNAGFTWPINHFAVYVIPGCFILAVFGAIWIGKKRTMSKTAGTASETGLLTDSIEIAGTSADQATEYSETIRTVIMRAVKVFAFVAALVLLGTGLQPLIIWFLVKVPALALFWINIISSVLDNATLTAIEISVQMSLHSIIAVVMGLLIAGGMLIPGNIPNIVAAGRLKISMREWAVLGLPVGLVLLVVFFLILLASGGI